MFKVLVVQYRLVTIEYFMDKMEEWEIYELYSVLGHSDSQQWEMTRWIMYSIIQSKTKKKIEINSLLKFPWDEGEKDKKNNTNISNEDISRLRKMSKRIAKNIR